MVAAFPLPSFEEDQHVVLRAMAWQDFEALLAIRGDRSGVRMYYLDEEIELASPTKIHEERQKTLARLLEIWAMESDVALNGFGSWTLKKELREAGAEPDECYGEVSSSCCRASAVTADSFATRCVTETLRPTYANMCRFVTAPRSR